MGAKQKYRVQLVTQGVLEKAKTDDLSSEELAERLGVTRYYIQRRARQYQILLKDMSELIPRKNKIQPKPVLPVFVSSSENPPPSPALIRLAQFDSIARRALALRRGEQATPNPEEDI